MPLGELLPGPHVQYHHVASLGPLDQLDATLARLPRRARVVAYCRGPYCVMAPEAVERLRAKGFKARRLADGMPEWRLAGLPVAVGEE